MPTHGMLNIKAAAFQNVLVESEAGKASACVCIVTRSGGGGGRGIGGQTTTAHRHTTEVK